MSVASIRDPRLIEQLSGHDWTRPESPYHALIRLIGGPWGGSILKELLIHDCLRFTELKREIGAIPAKSLSARLELFVEEGIVTRVDFGGMPPRVEYSLTDTGRELVPLLRLMTRWAIEHLDDDPVITPL